MQVIFSIKGNEHFVNVDDADNLTTILEGIEASLQSFPELRDQADLTVRITDGVLDSLADENEEIVLGELINTDA